MQLEQGAGRDTGFGATAIRYFNKLNGQIADRLIVDKHAYVVTAWQCGVAITVAIDVDIFGTGPHQEGVIKFNSFLCRHGAVGAGQQTERHQTSEWREGKFCAVERRRHCAIPA